MEKYENLTIIEKIDFNDFVKIFFIKQYDHLWDKISDKIKISNSWVIINKLSIVHSNYFMSLSHSLENIYTLELIRNKIKSTTIPKYWYISTKKNDSIRDELYKIIPFDIVSKYCKRNKCVHKTILDYYTIMPETVLSQLQSFKKIVDEYDNTIVGSIKTKAKTKKSKK